MEIQHGARVVAGERYRLRTLTVRDHLFSMVLTGNKGLYSAGRKIAVTPGTGVLLACGTQWDVVNDPARHGHYEAVVLAFDDEAVRELGSCPPDEKSIVVTGAHVLPVDAELSEAMQRTLPPKQTLRPSARLLRHRVLEVLLQLAERGYRFAPMAEMAWAERVRRMVASVRTPSGTPTRWQAPSTSANRLSGAGSRAAGTHSPGWSARCAWKRRCPSCKQRNFLSVRSRSDAAGIRIAGSLRRSRSGGASRLSSSAHG
nr:hypothetical protein [Propionivibrio soli]